VKNCLSLYAWKFKLSKKNDVHTRETKENINYVIKNKFILLIFTLRMKTRKRLNNKELRK